MTYATASSKKNLFKTEPQNTPLKSEARINNCLNYQQVLNQLSKRRVLDTMFALFKFDTQQLEGIFPFLTWGCGMMRNYQL